MPDIIHTCCWNQSNFHNPFSLLSSAGERGPPYTGMHFLLSENKYNLQCSDSLKSVSTYSSLEPPRISLFSRNSRSGWLLELSFFLGPRGPLVEPSIFPSTRPVPSRNNFSGSLIYRHTCLMNHQKSHQTNPMAQWDHIDGPLTPWDPVGLPLDPLRPCRPTP